MHLVQGDWLPPVLGPPTFSLVRGQEVHSCSHHVHTCVGRGARRCSRATITSTLLWGSAHHSAVHCSSTWREHQQQEHLCSGISPQIAAFSTGNVRWCSPSATSLVSPVTSILDSYAGTPHIPPNTFPRPLTSPHVSTPFLLMSMRLAAMIPSSAPPKLRRLADRNCGAEAEGEQMDCGAEADTGPVPLY